MVLLDQSAERLYVAQTGLVPPSGGAGLPNHHTPMTMVPGDTTLKEVTKQLDAAFGNFQIFNADGELLMFVGDRSERDGPAKYMLPSGIAVDEDGRVYVVDQWFRKIDVYRPSNLKADAGHLGRRPLAAR